MSTGTFEAGHWGLILGGSSGFGLATAHKLARHGLNLCIVHRDRRGAMKRIEPEFEALRERDIELVTHNTNALDADGRAQVLDGLAEAIGPDGGVRLLLHSIAFGNLKLVAPESSSSQGERDSAVARLAAEFGLDADRVAESADRLFADGVDGLQGLSTPPVYAQDRLLDDEDVARTIYAMGTSLLSWTQDLQVRGLFASDARVIGLTSEGNEVAWKGYAAVSAAKTALEAISRSIAVEMAHFGIRSNIVQAGVTDTPALRAIPGSAHLVAQSRVRNPFGRLTTPEDVADVVYLLTLPESAWINGALVRVDGGERVSGTSR
jgi:NAD(P)-dependent dehydrogenase (short-subunit alcohol dehydrogenase family)